MLHYKNGHLILLKNKAHYGGATDNHTKKKKIGWLEPIHIRLMGLLTALIVLANYCWLLVDKKPFAWDESIHYMGAIGYYRAVLTKGLGGLAAFWTQSDFYPPVTEWITGMTFFVTGPHPDVAAFLNTFYLIGTIILLLYISRSLFSVDSGVLASYLLISSAVISIQSKFFMLDIPLMFYCTLAFWAFIKSRLFMKRRWSIVYGVAFALAMLTKWSALFFLGLPPVVTAIVMTFKNEDERSRIWVNVIIAYGLGGLLAFPWYALHLVKLVKNTSGYFYERGALENDPVILSWQAWFYYLLGLFKQLSLPAGAVVLLGLGWSVYKRKHLALTGLWLLLPYIILTVIRNKDYRYTVPLLPIVCLMAASWLEEFDRKNKSRILIVTGLLLVGQLLYVHFGHYAGYLHKVFDKRVAEIPVIRSMAPDYSRWPLAAILSDVQESSKQLGREPLLRIIPDAAQFSKVTFVVEQAQHPYGVKLSSITDWPAFTDFAVTKTGGLGLPFLIKKQTAITESLFNTTTAISSRFELINRYPLPDGSEGRLYRRVEIRNDQENPKSIIDGLQKQIEQLLSYYVKDCSQLTIEVIPYSEEETTLGRFRQIVVRADHGLVGDFKHKPFGLPFETLEVALDDVILDMEKVRDGKLLPYALKTMVVRQLKLDAARVNQALTEGSDDLNKARLVMEDRLLKARYLGKLPLEAAVSLQVKKDRHSEQSDNLYFNVKRLKAGKLPVPGWFVQVLINDFNPLINLSGFPVNVKLGAMVIETGQLKMGTAVDDKLAHEQ